MHDVFFLITIGILIVLSAFFSASETAFSSLNKIRIKNLAKNGNKKAHRVLKISANYDILLSTVLIGNNIVNIALASLSTVLFVKYFGEFGVTYSTIVMTIVVLTFGEITPKSLAKENSDAFAMLISPILNILIKIFTPINIVFMNWKKFLIFMIKPKKKHGITDEELITIVEEAEKEGVFNSHEGKIIKSAIDFNDVAAKDILTPRIDIVAISIENDINEILKILKDSEYSRLPVYKNSLDDIIGIINQKDFYNYVVTGAKPLTSIINPVTFVPHTIKISQLLKLLQRRKIHIAIITDEYGGTMGMVTLEDILEELVGEIWDEQDDVVKEIEKISDKEYKIYGRANLSKVYKELGINLEPDFSTISGWVINLFGKIPKVGENVMYDKYKIFILKSDKKKIIEIKITIEDKTEIIE